jgi:hypothetical protein
VNGKTVAQALGGDRPRALRHALNRRERAAGERVAADPGRRNAFDGSITAGALGTPGQFRASYGYQYIQRDATVGAYNSDDWWYHTWYEGHRVALAWTFLPNVYLQGAVTLQRRLDTQYWVNRYLVDLVKMF